MNKPGGVDAQSFFSTTNNPHQSEDPARDASASNTSVGTPLIPTSTDANEKEPKKKSAWQRYKGLIIVSVVLFVLFIIVLVVMILHRKKYGPALPPGVKMAQSHAEDFSDKLQQFKDASEDIRKEISETHPDPKPLTLHRNN